MRILLLSGIWPPDVGGPATHGPDFARFLVDRGHQVQVVTMANGDVTDRPCPVETISRTHRFPIRYGLLAGRAAQLARQADVVYATATYAAAAAAAVTARRPLVAKLVSDPAYERAYRYGLSRGTLEEFQVQPGAALSTLRRARTLALSRARTIVVPSEYLAGIARRFGVDAERIVVVSNPAPDVAPTSQQLRPNVFVYAGRLTRQKALGVAIDAFARVPAAQLVVVGDGPERQGLERQAHEAGLDGRISFLGAQPRTRVLDLLGGAWASVLSSDWENLPHAAVESLALGTPVIATSVGGVPEVIRDGVNGLLVPPGSPASFAAAISRLVDEPDLRRELAGGAVASVVAISRDRVYGELERLLTEAAGA
jgi:glycosyltransferase involved in cell wall biosynthesis